MGDYKKYNKCYSFNTQFFYLDNKKINIKDYNNSIKKILCKNNHELIYVNGNKKKKYFRHKNNSDIENLGISEWHKEWSNNFNIKEKMFVKINEQVKNRYADAVIDEYNLVIEFQNSPITNKEVNDRINDYKQHNYEIIWIINGNDTINITELEYSNRIYIEFTKDYWKFESFMDCEYIYIDIKNKIYKIEPNKIKSYMIDILQPKSKIDFIYALKNNKIIWNDDYPYQCNLYIRQQGAGNGKTYGIVKNIEEEKFKHYKNIIMVTKQHSAKYIIYKEFVKQYGNNNNNYIKNINKIEKNKKYIIDYYNYNSKSKCQLIIATIDSLMYSICNDNNNNNDIDKFNGIVNSIINDDICSKKSGAIKYAGVNPKLNKETLLVMDECQDLKQNYAKAIIKIMRNRYIDTFVVGDILQSIKFIDNAFTYLYDNNFPNIKINKEKATNIVRRFTNPKLIEFVNEIIPFKKYNLPPIISYKNNDNNIENPIKFIKWNIYNNNDNDEYINKNIKKILKYIDNDTVNNNYLPEDFLIITPYTSYNNKIANLCIAIDEYWRNKINNDKEYINNVLANNEYWKNLNINKKEHYAYFHKSLEGTCIDLDISKHATRIVSCHSSKGDGRNVVFIIGLDEQRINSFSNETNNLIYNSIIHVALTRMKEKIYIVNGSYRDDVNTRFNNYRYNFNFIDDNDDEDYDDMNYNNINYNYNKLFNNNNNYNKLLNKIIDSNDNDNENNNDNINKNDKNIKNNNQIIELNHHNIRYSALELNFFLYIIYKHKDNNKHIYNEYYKLFKEILEISIIETKTYKEYIKLLYDKYKKVIPLYKKYNNIYDYNFKCYNIIIKNIKNIKNKIKLIINNNEQIILCPYESVILYYMIESYKQNKYTSIDINDLYDITNIYSDNLNKSNDIHNKCMCIELFNNNNDIIKDFDDNKNNIQNHYECIININKLYDMLSKKYEKIEWNYYKYISFNGKNKNFNIYNNFKTIGINKNNIFIIYIKPQFNDLNNGKILCDCLKDAYLINKSKDIDSYNKNIISIIISPDLVQPYIIYNNYKIKVYNKDILNIIKYNLISNYNFYHKYIYNFYKYIRNKFKCVDSVDFGIKIINELNKLKNYKKLPSYITDFFNNIIKKNIREKDNILKTYDNHDYFMKILNNYLEKSVNEYLNI